MAALENTVTTADVVEALDQEFAANFTGELSRLTEVLGIFGPEIVGAGVAMYQYTVTGQLNDAEVAEGDEVPLSHYEVEKTPIGEHTMKPYRKLTTAQAIAKGGFENSVLRTDRKMVKDVRADILSGFFAFLANGTGEATGTGLQGALAQADAKLSDTMETNGDDAGRIIHFVNTYDIADYLANAQVTTQTVFGMQYLQSFLGVNDIFVTNRVSKGTVYVTPVENIHVYGIDFGALAQGGLEYTVQDGGLLGVHHEANYARTSCETNVLVGCDILAEVTNYIVKATISAGGASGGGQTQTVKLSDDSQVAIKGTPAVTVSGTPSVNATIQGTPAVTISGQPIQTTTAAAAEAMAEPTEESTIAEIRAYAEANGVELPAKATKAQMLSAIKGE